MSLFPVNVDNWRDQKVGPRPYSPQQLVAQVVCSTPRKQGLRRETCNSHFRGNSTLPKNKNPRERRRDLPVDKHCLNVRHLCVETTENVGLPCVNEHPLKDAFHDGRGGAWVESVLVEDDGQSSVVVHVKRFVEEGSVPVTSPTYFGR